jgi:hypothetical protein
LTLGTSDYISAEVAELFFGKKERICVFLAATHCGFTNFRRSHRRCHHLVERPSGFQFRKTTRSVFSLDATLLGYTPCTTQPLHLVEKREERKEMEFQFEFVDEKASQWKFRMKIKTSYHEEEQREISYEQLQEIDLAVKPHNPRAAALFPRFQMWASWLYQPKTLDLERFAKVCWCFFSSALLSLTLCFLPVVRVGLCPGSLF